MRGRLGPRSEREPSGVLMRLADALFAALAIKTQERVG